MKKAASTKNKENVLFSKNKWILKKLEKSNLLQYEKRSRQFLYPTCFECHFIFESYILWFHTYQYISIWDLICPCHIVSYLNLWSAIVLTCIDSLIY